MPGRRRGPATSSHPRPDDLFTRIRIYRDHEQVAGPAFDELGTLLHELGHWRSWANGERPPDVDSVPQDPAKWPALLEEARRAILDEEARAWRYGYAIAEEVGFTDRDAYLARARRGLRDYCDRLPLPVDIAESFTVE